MPMSSGNYGKELVLDLHDCDVRLITEIRLTRFLDTLCDYLEMTPVESYWWIDLDNKEPHLAGISVVQFIRTSNITVHALTKLERVYINVFSCKDFNADKASAFIRSWFSGKVMTKHIIDRI